MATTAPQSFNIEPHAESEKDILLETRNWMEFKLYTWI